MKSIRIAAGQGFWGDWLEAPKHQIRRGPIDYLMLDYLAEVTMSILAKQHARDPNQGYARDFVELMGEIIPDIVRCGAKVLANAGGVNPIACAKAVRMQAKSLGYDREVKIAVVLGDDIRGSLDELLASGEELKNLDTGASFSEIRDRVSSANVYLGCEGLVEALSGGANIVISGRVADASLVLAPAIFEFGWADDDWNRRAAGIVAGHIIECGPQASGGNFSADWKSVPNLADVGYPIIEFSEDGSFVVTKHENTGGLVSQQTVKEQLVYEIGDPAHYTGPDVIADFTTLRLIDAGKNRVGVSNVRGQKRPDTLKASISYFDGYTAAGTLVYSWPEACEKARAAETIIRQRLRDLGLSFSKIHSEIIGINACHAALSDRDIPDIPEVMLRVAVHSQDQRAVKRFTREIAPLVLGGPPSATGYAAGKGQVQEVIAFWPALIGRERLTTTVKYY